MDFFKDSHGHTVIVQKPNLPIYIALGFYLIRYLPFEMSIVVSQWGVIVTLLYWAYLEIFYGVNVWRRILGVIVGLLQLYILFQRI